MKISWITFAFVSSGFLVSSFASGQSGTKKSDRIQSTGVPVEMTAKGGLKIDLEKRIGIAEKDVVIRRNDVTVCCDRATARYDKANITSVECRGRVVVVRPDGSMARADRAIFEATQDKVTLQGDAKFRSSDTELEGEEIVYDVARDKLNVRGSKSRFRFLPKNQATLPLGRKCPP